MRNFQIQYEDPVLVSAEANPPSSPSGRGEIIIGLCSVRFFDGESGLFREEFKLAEIANVQRSGKALRIELPGGSQEPFIFFKAADDWDAEAIESLLTKKTTTPLREVSLEFQGQSSEYFRIWIVNICLTLLTLGIFSAWAKVRNKRYLYSHTLLDGTPFQYLGKPLPILRGRLIAVALFLIYFISSNLVPSVLPLVICAGLLLAPWVIVRSAAFTARYSAYRNMTFGFDGNYAEAAKTLYWFGLIPILAVGSAFDWGGSEALDDTAFSVFGLLFPFWLARLKAFLIGSTRFGGIRGQLRILDTQLWGIYFRGGLLSLGPIVAMMILLFLSAKSQASQASFDRQYAFRWHALALALLAALAGYAFSHGYIQSNSGNLVWSNTRLGTVRFESDLRTGDLVWLYFSNAIAIISSAALMTPWAVVRTIRYRTSHMHVLSNGDLAAFEGSETRSVQAAGAEVGQIFDLDLSL
jgi:uncharacterized membrane protein YjgN (DUF898 family)